ncbi:MAG: hypothetical protein KKE91_01845, partial [Candidatus Omnitrophica bacterium]|nr:hypothetical protein [Candidatus Omnitrophota bacterium]
AVRSSPTESMPGLLLTKTGISTREDFIKAIKDVYDSWNSPLAKEYKEKNKIGDSLSLPILVQVMVFGDKNSNSASGVLFTRDVITGENKLSGRFAVQSKGEDIVQRKDSISEAVGNLKQKFPKVYQELIKTKEKLEKEFGNVQEVEFVIEDGKLWIVQTRDAALSPKAQVKTTVDMAKEGLITQGQMLVRIENAAKKKVYRLREDARITEIGQGTPSSPGAVKGVVAFSLDEAKRIISFGKTPIFIAFQRIEEIISAILNGEIGGIITQYGHEALHESVLARSRGIPLIDNLTTTTHLEEGMEIVIDGTDGKIYITEEENPLIEDKIIIIEGIDFDYHGEEELIRAKYGTFSYENLISLHGQMAAELRRLTKVTIESLRLELTARIIHQELIPQKGKELGKNETEIEKDIISAYPEYIAQRFDGGEVKRVFIDVWGDVEVTKSGNGYRVKDTARILQSLEVIKEAFEKYDALIMVLDKDKIGPIMEETKGLFTQDGVGIIKISYKDIEDSYKLYANGQKAEAIALMQAVIERAERSHATGEWNNELREANRARSDAVKNKDNDKGQVALDKIKELMQQKNDLNEYKNRKKIFVFESEAEKEPFAEFLKGFTTASSTQQPGLDGGTVGKNLIQGGTNRELLSLNSPGIMEVKAEEVPIDEVLRYVKNDKIREKLLQIWMDIHKKFPTVTSYIKTKSIALIRDTTNRQGIKGSIWKPARPSYGTGLTGRSTYTNVLPDLENGQVLAVNGCGEWDNIV